jgi:polysaccharide deacetylase family protein (PEP-CTERM system associated)
LPLGGRQSGSSHRTSHPSEPAVTPPHLDSDRDTSPWGDRLRVSQHARPSALLTVSLEDYFQVGSFGSLIPRGQWYRFESRVEQGLTRTLDLLGEHGATATVFVLGIVAERFPELVRAVRDRGHEVASKGYQHCPIREMTHAALAEDLQRAREAIEGATRERVSGCRISGWLTPRDSWALDVMADHGYLYDSSMRPFLRSHAGVAAASRRPHRHHVDATRSIWEIPVSSVSLLGCDLPLAGGNFMRQLPHTVVRRGIARLEREAAPIVLYFHSWELDAEQPRIDGAPPLARLRHYRNLHRMPDRLRHYLRRYACRPIGEWLGAEPHRPTPAGAIPALRVSGGHVAVGSPALVPPARSLPRVPVSVVIPCFNEERALPYLANTLRRLEASLGSAYDLRFLVVDDGSTDDTAARLRALFVRWANVIVLRHTMNRGLAAAIRTGVLTSTTEIVCSMDCDCSYDPHELARMIPRLRAGVDLVVASPYHPDGAVRNVPLWRRMLSKSLARCYRTVLHQPLHSYTSSFRVYRRSRLLALRVRRGGFIGVTETLARLDLDGATIVEHPVTLDARIFGRSRLRIAHNVAGHLGLLVELAWHRARRGGRAPSSARARSRAAVLDGASR